MAQVGTRRNRRRRAIRPNELLAIDPGHVQSDRGAFFWLFGPSVRSNERVGDVSVVRVNGPLEHHDDGWGDSYELLQERVRAALSGEDIVEEETRKHRWEDDFEAPSPSPPKAVVLRIDSPGGVVSGLNECVRSLRKMAKRASIPLVAYVDEMAASAAYALCCACSRIVGPASSIIGSVGVISTMVDQSARDQREGFRFVVLTSGERKADGHVHVPISDEAIAAERPRVMQLAAQFWKLVTRARPGMTVKQVRSYEAGIFLGADAVEADLSDDVMTWDAFLAELNGTLGLAQGGTTVSPSLAQSDTETDDMALTAEQNLRNAIAKEKDPARLSALKSALESYKKEKHTIEKHETEEGDEEDEEDEEEEGGNETDRGDDPEDDEDDEDEEDEEDEDEEAMSDDEEKKCALALQSARAALAIATTPKAKKRARASLKSAKFRLAQVRIIRLRSASRARLTLAAIEGELGVRGAKAVRGALKGLVASAKQNNKALARLQADASAREVEALISDGRRARKITPGNEVMVRQEIVPLGMSALRAFIKTAPAAVLDEFPMRDPSRSLAREAPGAAITIEPEQERIWRKQGLSDEEIKKAAAVLAERKAFDARVTGRN